MNNTVRFLQVLTDSNLSWFSFSLGTNFPIMRETKAYWIINISGDVEKKVMKSTFRLAGYKDSPLFAIYEPQPETLETSTPSRFEHLVGLQTRFPLFAIRCCTLCFHYLRNAYLHFREYTFL